MNDIFVIKQTDIRDAALNGTIPNKYRVDGYFDIQYISACGQLQPILKLNKYYYNSDKGWVEFPQGAHIGAHHYVTLEDLFKNYVLEGCLAESLMYSWARYYKNENQETLDVVENETD